MFEGLVRFTPDGRIEPSLALSWKWVDETTMQFKLRKGVRFHDGEPFDAESVKFSINRYLDPKIHFPAFGFISSLKAVEIIDPYTVNIITCFPDGLLLNRLAAFVVMVPASYADREETDLENRPVGTGAFRFKSWDRTRELRLEANPDYWDRNHPKVDGLVFKFLPMEEQVDALLRGDIDILTSLPGTRTLAIQKNPDTTVIKKRTFYTVAGSFNIGRKPLSNKRIRQALNLAVDKDDLIHYDILGNGRPIAGLSMADEFGHSTQVDPYPYNPKKAKQILKEEGYPDGFRLKVFLKANAERTGQIVAAYLARVGVVLDLTIVTDAEIFKYLEDGNRWDMLIADCPDPMYHSYFISAAFLYSKSPFSISPNPEFDKRLETIIRTLDLEKQKLLSEDLDRYIHDEALALFTYQRTRTYGLRRGLEFVPYTSGMHYFQSVTKTEK